LRIGNMLKSITINRF